MGPDSTIPVSLKAITDGDVLHSHLWGCGASSGTMCYLKKKVVGLRWRILFYLIWGSRFLRLLVPSPFCHFEFWQGIDKCFALVNLVFQKPYLHVSVIIFLPVPGLSTEPVRSLRAPIDLNCPDWPHLRPPHLHTLPMDPGAPLKFGSGGSVADLMPWVVPAPDSPLAVLMDPVTCLLRSARWVCTPWWGLVCVGAALSSHPFPSPLLALAAHLQGTCAGCWWSVSAIRCFWKRYWAARSSSFWLVLFTSRMQGGWSRLSFRDRMVRSASSWLLFSPLSFLFVL